jgi:GTPase SAR1 family protein
MEKFKQITTSYYRGAQAAIICFDLTNRHSFDSVPKWVNDFSLNHNPIFERYIILIGNKADLIENREVSREEIENYVSVNKFLYFETSAKTGDNVDELFYTIGKNLYLSYKNNRNSQINNAIQIKRTASSITYTDNFQNLLKEEEKKKSCVC